MAYLTIARISGDAAELVEGYKRSSAVMSGVGRDHRLIAHVAATTDAGLLIVNLWPSRGGSEAAARDPRRLGVLEQGASSIEEIRREHHEVVDYELFD
jgi:hypothetical protein